MSELRSVAVSAEQIATIESVGQDLLRQGDATRGLALLALCLAWRSVGIVIAPARFQCEPDESAGLAEVVDLHSYSRKVGA